MYIYNPVCDLLGRPYTFSLCSVSSLYWTLSTIEGERYLGVIWKGVGREYFYSFWMLFKRN
jgi:hypothetical protein